MHVMDIYSVKQPQNIIKVKMKEQNWKKRILEKSWIKFILLPLFCLWDSHLFSLFTWSGKAVQLTWYEFSTYLHQLQSLSLV